MLARLCVGVCRCVCVCVPVSLILPAMNLFIETAASSVISGVDVGQPFIPSHYLCKASSHPQSLHRLFGMCSFLEKRWGVKRVADIFSVSGPMLRSELYVYVCICCFMFFKIRFLRSDCLPHRWGVKHEPWLARRKHRCHESIMMALISCSELSRLVYSKRPSLNVALSVVAFWDYTCFCIRMQSGNYFRLQLFSYECFPSLIIQ